MRGVGRSRGWAFGYGFSCAVHGAAVAGLVMFGSARFERVDAGAGGDQVMVVDLAPAPAIAAALPVGDPEPAAIGRRVARGPSPAPARGHRPLPRRPDRTRVIAAAPSVERTPDGPARPSATDGPTEQSPPEQTPGVASVTPATSGAGTGGVGLLPQGGGGGRGDGTGRAGRPPTIPPQVARYLRTEESYPRLPEPLRRPGAVYVAETEICVSQKGRVQDVTITRSAAPELDRVLVAEIREWKYRPRMVDGAPTPFCHLMRFDYRRL